MAYEWWRGRGTDIDNVSKILKKWKETHGSDSDFVNHPSHYTSGDVECIDAIRASMSTLEFIGYLRGNCLKYVWRYDKKGGVVDLEKAAWYLNKLIEEYNDMSPYDSEGDNDD